MWFVIGLSVAAANWVLWRDPQRRRACMGLLRAVLEESAVACGFLDPTPGHLQRAALRAVAGLRTVSVTGAVRLPPTIEVVLSPDAATVALLLGDSFLDDVADELEERASLLRLSGPVPGLHLVVEETAGRFRWRPVARAVAASHSAGHPMPAGRFVDDEPVVTVRYPEPGRPPTPDAPPSVGPGRSLASPPVVTVAVPSETEVVETAVFSELMAVFESHPLLGPVRAGSADSEVVLGRTRGDVVVPVETVSARHCRFLRGRDGAWMVEDLGSRNGTYLNGGRLLGQVRVLDGDVVNLGTQVTLRVR
jgi:hypothetical protein